MGLRIVTDPFGEHLSNKFGFPSIRNRAEIIADIITVSHEHADHNAVNEVNQVEEGAKVIRAIGDTEVKGLIFHGISSFHDKVQGTKLGDNTIFVFTVDRIIFCHLGDLGHILNDQQIKEIGKVDVLFIPVGGPPATINADEATIITNKLKPKIVIPMHYQYKRIKTIGLATVNEFLKGKSDVKLVKSDTIIISRDELTKELQVVVLLAQ